MTTLLGLMQAVTDELGLATPSVITGSQDPQIRQLNALFRRLGTDLVRQHDWQRLIRETVVITQAQQQTGTVTAGSAVVTGLSSTTGLDSTWAVNGLGVRPFSQVVSVDSATQITLNMPAETSDTVTLSLAKVQYALPADWKKQIPQTEWDRTNRWPLLGPNTPQDWQSFKSGVVYSGPRQRFRILGNTLTIDPPPPDGLVLAYEYVADSWVVAQDGTRKSEPTADTDTFLFPDSLLITGLKTAWKAAKGLDGAFDLGEFRAMLEQYKAQESSAPKLSLAPMDQTILLTTNNIPDGNWSA